MKTQFFLFFVLLSFFLNFKFASAENLNSEIERNPAQLIQNRELIEKAKAHRYKGGSEEGELRVQAQLPKPQRKISPVIDKKENDPDGQDHD